MKALELDGFQVVMTHPTVLQLPNAEVEADDEIWGTMPLADAQKRLEDDDDFAILVLRTEFTSEGDHEGLTIEVNSEGLRLLEVDGKYLVPVAGAAPEGFERYLLPSPFPAGEHSVQWSFVWQPPVDKSSGEKLDDGVTLMPLRLQGPGVSGQGGVLTAAPDTANLGDLDAAGFTGAGEGLSFKRAIELPSGLSQLVLEGPGAAHFQPHVDGIALPAVAETVGQFTLPPGSDGTVELELSVTDTAASLTGITLR